MLFVGLEIQHVVIKLVLNSDLGSRTFGYASQRGIHASFMCHSCVLIRHSCVFIVIHGP